MRIYVAKQGDCDDPVLVTTSKSRVLNLLDRRHLRIDEIQIWEDNEICTCLDSKVNCVPLREAFEERWREIFFGHD